MESWVDEAINFWKAEGIRLNEGATSAEIEELEDRIGFKFPDDFRSLYSSVNGFVDFDSRGMMLSLWSLSRIWEDHDPTKRFVMFADHFISVCQYGFDKKNVAGVFRTFTHHQQGSGDYMAESFQQFIALFNADAEELF